MSLQLVGVTAALVFATSTVSAIGFVLAMARQWHVLSAIPRTWLGFYYPVVFSPVFYALLAIVSAIMFAALLFARRSVLLKVSAAYIAALLLALVWRIYIHFPSGGMDGLRLASPTSQVYFGLRFLYAVWLISLAIAVLPNYSLKRTAARGCGILSLFAAAA